MLIAGLTDEQLEVFVENYRNRDAIVGGKFSLGEVLLEQIRRKPTEFPPREMAEKIIELVQNSEDGVCTYGELWSEFRPADRWEGNKTQKKVTNGLAHVIRYCRSHNLPILSTLVVKAGKRQLEPKAVRNIYEFCRDLGLDVGLDPEGFVTKQAELARALCINDLPIETESASAVSQ
jgi:hypothetical protein